MGGKGSGRKPEPKTPVASTSGEDFIIPNLSGEHTAGTTATPISNRQIANKEYVDAQVVDWTISQAPNVIHADNYTDTDTTYTSSDFTHDSLTGVDANEHLDWTADLGATNINAANYTDTGDTTAHASFTQLDYASAGHTGFAPALGADDNYVTDTEKVALHVAVTLNASATTGGLSLSTQEISHRAATNAQTGYMTAALVGNIETNNAKETDVNHNVTTNLSAGTRAPTTIDVNSSDGNNATLVEADTTNAGILGSDKWDEIVANTAAKHTQNTDTALGSGAVAADHGTAATDQVVNVCYGTGDPPAANTTTEGSLFVKYTA